jgi:hypothetical protein
MDYTYERTLAGWPARAVLTGRLSTPIKPQLVTLVEIGPIPIWRGVAIDTAFYSGLAFVLWCAPRVIRWQRRRARGQCPACGYDLSGLPQGSSPLPCPECGAKRAAPRHH